MTTKIIFTKMMMISNRSRLCRRLRGPQVSAMGRHLINSNVRCDHMCAAKSIVEAVYVVLSCVV